MNAYCASTTKYPGRCEPSPAVHGGRVLLPGYLLNTPLLKTVLHPSVCVQQMNSGATLKRQNTEWRGRIPCAWAVCLDSLGSYNQDAEFMSIWIGHLNELPG